MAAAPDYIDGFGTTLAENIGALEPTLRENVSTLFENSPITSARPWLIQSLVARRIVDEHAAILCAVFVGGLAENPPDGDGVVVSG